MLLLTELAIMLFFFPCLVHGDVIFNSRIPRTIQARQFAYSDNEIAIPWRHYADPARKQSRVMCVIGRSDCQWRGAFSTGPT